MEITDIILLIFTCVIAVSTAIYALYSIRLWKATRSSVDVARYASFINLMVQLGQYVEDAERKGLPEAVFLKQFFHMIAEFGFEKFLEDIDMKGDASLREYFGKIEGMLRAYNIDPSSVPWYRPVRKKLED